MKSNEVLPLGKLESNVLIESVLNKITHYKLDVKVGAEFGEDCSLVSFGEEDCVISSDPITASTKDLGSLAITISCNDVASSMGEPLGITLTLLLPEGTTRGELEKIMEDADAQARKNGVEIIGGHTEITKVVQSPVAITTAFGKRIVSRERVEEERAFRSKFKEGELLLGLTKGIGIEGTGIIFSEKEDELGAFFSRAEIEEGKSYIERTSVVKEGVIASNLGITQMHDVTEGGVLGGAYELAKRLKLGLKLFEEKLKPSPLTEKLAKHYNIDALSLISSGSMLVVIDIKKLEKLKAHLSKENIDLFVIGEFTPNDEAIVITNENGEKREVMPPKADQLYKVL